MNHYSLEHDNIIRFKELIVTHNSLAIVMEVTDHVTGPQHLEPVPTTQPNFVELGFASSFDSDTAIEPAHSEEMQCTVYDV
ncbi:kinase super protein [Cymbomonas tetramitiformis]|uniref:Kinase super protein n=1 Tax=Cymbomonas tetramitiformis TaxID=36881 RepID=A0AAE0BKS9_9CHLO|nr:kinase super protein [Cymbomonas tetramitiformis]